jgi:hypothetical protein
MAGTREIEGLRAQASGFDQLATKLENMRRVYAASETEPMSSAARCPNPTRGEQMFDSWRPPA